MNFEQKKNTKAAAWTLGIHSVLLLIFILCKYTMPVQAKVEDLGIEVNLGTSDNGSGTDQPEAMDDPAAANAATATNAAAALDNDDKEINTTDDENAPSINIRHPKPVNRPNTQAANNTPNRRTAANSNNSNARVTAPAQSPRYVYPGATGKGGNSAQQNTPGTSEGIGTGNGDMGVPGGTPGASNYTGTPGAGGGSSMNLRLSGRSLVERPVPNATFKEGGKVKVHIVVNRNGDIIEYYITAPNEEIRQITIEKLKHTKYNKSPNAPPRQIGNITFDFRATRK